VYLSRLELEKSTEIARSLDFNDVNQLLRGVEAECAAALNLAGMKAFEAIGEHPVIISSFGNASEVNQFRVKEIIREELIVYLTSHYLDNMFANSRYAVNVVLWNETPIPSAENITLEKIPMQLNRTTIPLIGPAGTRNYSAYWIASVPLTFEIRQIHGGDWTWVASRTVRVSSILTSRYPLLEQLVTEYEQAINGSFSPLWTYTTVFSNLYAFIRGLRHFESGKPLNVVDNHHLAVILNSGLLLQQSLVFSSVDPLGIVELARHIGAVLKQTPQDSLTVFNEEMTGDGYTVDTENMTSGSANVDSGEPLNASIDQGFTVNFSEVAERVLYNISSVTLRFENAEGDVAEEEIAFDGDVQARIQDAVMRWMNQSFSLLTLTRHLVVNRSALHYVQELISGVYQALMETRVVNRTVVEEIWGDPGPGWSDGGASPWNSTMVMPVQTQMMIPPKGMVLPGCALYQEVVNVSYERTHVWWEPGNTWKNMTDHLVETVCLQVILEHYATTDESQDDVVDVCYYNETVDDPNLDDTLGMYLTMYPDSHPDKLLLIVTRENQGSLGCEATIPGSSPAWVTEEAWGCLDDILDGIREIAEDPIGNGTNSTNPLTLVGCAGDSFLRRYEQHLPEYLEYSAYHPGPGFRSVGKKAVYCARDWFVTRVWNETSALVTQLSTRVTSAIEDAIPPNAGFDAQNLSETLDDAADAVRNQCTIPFGCEMMLTACDDQNTSLWNESVRLAVDQVPNYLDPFEKTGDGEEELWTLKLRNRCILGPTGLPILPPSPVTPWVMTLNVWVIDVEGEYSVLKIIDSSDETIFNPLLGHEPQVLVRRAEVVTGWNVTLGENTRVGFGFSTVAVGVVPPWGMMLGDLQIDWYDEATPGFREAE
jgi:hypothetical protein